MAVFDHIAQMHEKCIKKVSNSVRLQFLDIIQYVKIYEKNSTILQNYVFFTVQFYYVVCIIYLKIKFLSSFIYPHVVQKLYNTSYFKEH